MPLAEENQVVLRQAMEADVPVPVVIPGGGGGAMEAPTRPVRRAARRNELKLPAPAVQQGNIAPAKSSQPPRVQVPKDQELERDAIDLPPRKESGVGVLKRIGDFLLGPKLGATPVKCIEQYLARKENTDEFYVLKILTRKPVGVEETMDDKQGKMLLHTERSILPLLENEPGVIHQHGLYRYTVKDQVINEMGEVIIHDVRRLVLVLDCFVAHDFSPRYSSVTNLQTYVIKEKRLPESVAIRIFCKILEVVEKCHELCIVHRDLKLGNIVFNKVTQEVRLNNFCLGKRLAGDNDLLTDQRGSPAYVSPELAGGKAYEGKPSDMWALGITLYSMLFGQFPFYDKTPETLFRKIKAGVFQIPADVSVSSKTLDIIFGLLNLNPKNRLTASQALEKVRGIIAGELALMTDTDLQVVPASTFSEFDAPKRVKRSFAKDHSLDKDLTADIAKILGLGRAINGEEADDSAPQQKKTKMIGSSADLVKLIAKFALDDQEMRRMHAAYVASKISAAAGFGKLTVCMVKNGLATQVNAPTAPAPVSGQRPATAILAAAARNARLNIAGGRNNGGSGGAAAAAATTPTTNNNDDYAVVPSA